MPMDPFIGEITIFAGNFAPRGWAFCDGQLLSVQQNTTLFSILGTTYGGDGRSTFALPDLRGRAPVGPGRGPGLSNKQLGERGGTESTTLGVNNMPNHAHGVALHGESQVSTTGDPTDRLLGVVTGDTKIYADANASANVAMNASSITENAVGGGQSFTNEAPYLAVHYIIALQGNYPSRN